MSVVNDQWELTEDSLSGRGKLSYYHIMAHRLTEDGNEPYGKEMYDWPIQMAQKANFDYEQFVQAFNAALQHFAGKYQPEVDQEKLKASLAKGREFDENKHRPERA